jgi:hypothetical protein
MAYDLHGYMLEFCNCNVLCPCWIGEDPDNGDCQGILAWHIERGTIDGTDVSGRTYAALGVLGVIDDGASDAQHTALADVFGGKLGGPLADLAKLIGEVVDVVRANVTTDVVEGTGSLKIGDLVDGHMQAYQGHFGKATNLQESLFATYPGAPAYISKASSYVQTTARYGIPDVNLQGRNAVQSFFHFEG